MASFTLGDVQEQQDAAIGHADSASAGSDHAPHAHSEPSLARAVALYTVARFGMLAVIAGILMGVVYVFGGQLPLLVAVAVAAVVAMPLSLVAFPGLRHRVAVGMAERAERRRAQQRQLREQLRGERAEDDAEQGEQST